MPLGPFDVSPQQVQALGSRFTEFVNRLLEAESSRSGLAGHQLRITSFESVADGGVDAATRDATATGWMPAGSTAWQFKRGDLQPAQCAAELKAATWAHEFLKAAGSYVLVLGKPWDDRAVERRRNALVNEAIVESLIAADNGQIRVYDANQVARWASQYPALAVSQVAGSSGRPAIDHQSWGRKRTFQTAWTADASRTRAIALLRDRLQASGVMEVRVQGESGLGKTRLVLEALRDNAFAPLVAYVAEVDPSSGELLERLVAEERVGILVVDECSTDRHIKLAERLPVNATIKLITIGRPGLGAIRGAAITFDPMPASELQQFLKSNFGALGDQACRFIADHCEGNMQWSILFAERILGGDATQAAELIARNDIEQFITSFVPEGADFFASAVLALLERVGWDRELRPQLELLATFAEVQVDELLRLGRDLEHRGLMTRHGRYRSVSPQPFAIYLAAEAWRREGHRIIEELLPNLNGEMALGLFERVAELGRYGPAAAALSRLLAPDGPFSSLEAIERQGSGRLLTQLAIVLPGPVGTHLADLIADQDVERLREVRASRRDIVWSLEKVVWHTQTFEVAADALLKLALAENEPYANNATGTWVSLFGTLLPGTAASPAQRAEYLRRIAHDARPEARQLAIQAAQQMFVIMEGISISGELQAGALVESRGSAVRWEEVKRYRDAAVEILDTLLTDSDTATAEQAASALVDLLPVALHDPIPPDRLIKSLGRLDGVARRRLRAQTEKQLGIYERHRAEDRVAIGRLKNVLATLAPPSVSEQFDVLAHMQRWDLGEGELQKRLDSVVSELTTQSQLPSILIALESEIPAAWEVGYALARSSVDNAGETQRGLVSAINTNPGALAGFLAGLVDSRHGGAFDDFLDSEIGSGLEPRLRLFLAVRGPVTAQARARILKLAQELPVATAAPLLFGWQRNIEEHDALAILRNWQSRISSQDDYNSTIGWLSIWLYGKTDVGLDLDQAIGQIVVLRSNHPDLRQQQWDWAQLAKRVIGEKANDLASLILDAVESGAVMIFKDDPEASVLKECCRASPETVWTNVGDRILRGGWRVQMQIQGWLLDSVPARIVIDWIAADVSRARLVARIAPVGGDEPSSLVRLLLETFGSDEMVAGALRSQLLSGFWIGNESDRLARQIEQLKLWGRSTEPLGVRDWAKTTIDLLEERRIALLEREAEEAF
jgi:hypothetical protein